MQRYELGPDAVWTGRSRTEAAAAGGGIAFFTPGRRPAAHLVHRRQAQWREPRPGIRAPLWIYGGRKRSILEEPTLTGWSGRGFFMGMRAGGLQCRTHCHYEGHSLQARPGQGLRRPHVFTGSDEKSLKRRTRSWLGRSTGGHRAGPHDLRTGQHHLSKIDPGPAGDR